MTHPIIPQIIELANPIAQDLNLEIVGIVFQTNRRIPTLRIDINNINEDTGLNDCERFSRSLEKILEEKDVILGAYVLEVSSPGIPKQISSEREFNSFKGFDVLITTSTPFENQQQWRGKLQGRDLEGIYLNQKGRTIMLPLHLVATVELDG